MTTTAFQLLEELLRSPASVAEHCRSERDPKPLFLASLLATVAGAAVFGGVLATSRGGWQLLYSATKLPLALLGTLILVVPALHAIASGLGRPLKMSNVATLVLAASGRAALVLLSLSPVVWLAFDRGLGYHGGVLLAAGCYGVSGLAALELLRKGLGSDLRSLLVIGCFGLVLLPTAGQTAWMLRPFLGRPAQAHVPFLRARESSFADSVYHSAESSMGIYRELESHRERQREGERAREIERIEASDRAAQSGEATP
jgi:hypothetical protein